MEHIHLYNTSDGIFAYVQNRYILLDGDWDTIVNVPHLFQHLNEITADQPEAPEAEEAIRLHLMPPVGLQEVWAAGVTYYRSRVARMEESEVSGGATFYDMVYEAERPELFFKSTARRVIGHGHGVHIRKDSDWNVPEPELTLFINNAGAIAGYTIGNDMSSRSIEGENPLYLPQAKVYERSAAIGPCLLVPQKPLSTETLIQMQITRQGEVLYKDEVAISKMKRTHEELVEFLYREMAFPDGCYLMTGTCLVPDSSFTLQENDVIEITIEPIGTLINTVGIKR